MTNLLPLGFPKATPPAIASYDFTDIAEGTGIVLFYGFTAEAVDGGDHGYGTYHLSTNPSIFSDSIESTFGVPSATTVTECDFDTAPFNLPKEVDGTAYINFTWKVTNTTGTNNNYATVTIRKWDGTTETDLVVASGAAVSSSTVATDMFKCTVPRTHFKAGEQLRVSVGLSKTTAGDNPQGHIAHDPQNRDGTQIQPSGDATLTTKMLAFIPFRIET